MDETILVMNDDGVWVPEGFDNQILDVAKRHFHVETLDERKRDSLDFHDVSVASMKAALEEAYFLGQQDGISLGTTVNVMV